MTTPPINPKLSPATLAHLGTLAHRLAHGDKTRAPFAELVKQASPADAKSFDDVFLRQEIEKAVQEFRDERQAEKIEAITAKQQQARQKLISDGRYTEDQVKEMENGIMTRYGGLGGDYEAAATLYAAEHPPEHPSLKVPDQFEDHSATWEFGTVPDRQGKEVPFKEFMKDPRKASLNAAIYTIQNFKRSALPSSFHRG